MIVKIAAVNRLSQAARRLRKLTVNRRSLFGAVSFLLVVAFAYMVTWTVVDPPRILPLYIETSEETSDGDTVIRVTHYCRSQSDSWAFISLGAQCILLLAASVLAFQTRKIKDDLCETQTLALLIYTTFLFVVIRTISFGLLEKSNFAAAVNGTRSLVVSVDSILSVIVYFLPKFLAKPHSQLGSQFESGFSRSSSIYIDTLFPTHPPPRSDGSGSGPTIAPDAPGASAGISRITNCPHCNRILEQSSCRWREEQADEPTSSSSNPFEGACAQP